MKVNTKITHNELQIFFEGELDQSVAEKVKIQLDDFLDRVTPSKVILNMKLLSFMDSTGIGLIMGRYKKLRAKQIPMYIVEPNKQIDKILKISGLYSIIPLLR